MKSPLHKDLPGGGLTGSRKTGAEKGAARELGPTSPA